MRRRTYILAVLGIGALLASFDLQAAPKAGLAASTWQLDMGFHDPQRIRINLPGASKPTTFWYFLYRVTNSTGQDREFYPSFRLVTDTLQVVEGGANISPIVYDAIAARHKDEFPFLAPPSKVTGPLLQGRENARASVAVFRDFDPKASSFTVFAAGMSGDLARTPNPAFDASKKDSKANPRFFLLRRTLAVRYDIPGDLSTRDRSIPIRSGREWIMR